MFPSRASLVACELAYEIGVSPALSRPAEHGNIRSRSGRRKHVSFHESIDIHVVDAFSSVAVPFQCQHHDLVNCQRKPWSLEPSDVHRSILDQVIHKMRIPIGWSALLSIQAVSSCPHWIPNVMPKTSNLGWSAPLSFQAVSSCPQSEANRSKTSTESPPVFQAMTQAPNPDRRNSLTRHEASSFPHAAALGTGQIENSELHGKLWHRHRRRPDQPLDSCVVRTWYLHHGRHQVCRVFRLVKLDGHFHSWQSRLLAVWNDRIRPDGSCEAHIVHPTSDHPSDGFIFVDVLLLQGQHLRQDKIGSLITFWTSDPPVHIADTMSKSLHGRELFRTIGCQNDASAHWYASSCYSKFHDAVDPVHTLWQAQRIDVFPQTVDAPLLDDEHVSMMQVTAHVKPTCTYNQDAQPLPPTIPVAVPLPDHVPAEHVEHQDGRDDDHDDPNENPGRPDDMQQVLEENRQPAILYSLIRRPLRVFLIWTTYEDMLAEIARHFAVTIHDIAAVHELQAQPDDVHESTTPMLVQLAPDLEPGSWDILAVVDIDFPGRMFP